MAAPEAVLDDRAPETDEDLVARIGAGEREAFDLLYERFFPRVFRFVQRRLSNRADAEETVQEVFINIFSSLHTYRGEAAFGAWVLGLTRRTIARRFKKKRHPTVPLESDETELFDATLASLQQEPTPHEHYEYRERVATLQHRATRQLTREQRELFERHHLHHESIQDIARLMDKSEDAVKSNLYRARKLLFAR